MTSTLRQTVTALGVAGVASASLLGLAGTASAATTTASSCTKTVAGHSGDSLRMSATAVKSQVLSSVSNSKPLILLGQSDREKVQSAYDQGKIKPLALGKVKSSTYAVSGNTIAEAVLNRLESTDGLKSVAENGTNRHNIRTKVGDACGLTVKVASAAGHQSTATTHHSSTAAKSSSKPNVLKHVTSSVKSATQWPSKSAPATTEKKAPATADAPEVNTAKSESTPGRRAKRDYSHIPYASPGTRPDGSTFNSAPFGAQQPAKSPYMSDQVNKAGDASKLSPGQGGPIPVPLLAAVVALAGASAGLVRTWMMRRVATR